MSFNLNSLILGLLCVLQILFSLPVSAFIIRVIGGVTYFCPLHIFAVIVILGIGADDIFVFADIWAYTKGIKAIRDKMNLRMSYTYRKAGLAMLETSITTMASFIATGMSPIMPIVSFGMFSAIVVCVNYIMIILFLPAVFYLYEKDLKFKLGIYESV